MSSDDATTTAPAGAGEGPDPVPPHVPHRDREAHLQRLRRIEGQVCGI